MTIIENLLNEIEQEAQITRKFLKLIPEDKFDWRPHPKSMNLQQLSTHIAELPAWITMTVTTDGLDFATTPYEPSKIDNVPDLLDFFEQSYADGYAHLKNFNETDLEKRWLLRHGEQILIDRNKYETLRMCIAQIIHHRAQLGVFLRLLDIPIPGSYGPSADEMGK